MKIKILGLLLVLSGIFSPLTYAAQPNAESLAASIPATMASKSDVYIVRLSENPVAAYDGEISGYKATRPATGEKT